MTRRIGLDLALRAAHRAVVFDDAEPVGRPFRVPCTKAGMDELERRGTAGTEGPCEFIMEPTGLVWLSVAAEMARRGHRIYVPKPQKTHALRKFYSQFAKSDGIDAQAQALVRHVAPKQIHELRVPSAPQTSLRLCVKQRARLAAEATKCQSRIGAWLLLANPHLSKAFGSDMFTKVGRALLRRYVDPFLVRRRGKGQIRQLCKRHAHRRFNEKQFDAIWRACMTSCELYDELHAAGALPFDYALLQQLVCQQLDRLEFCEMQQTVLEQSIRRLYRQLDPQRTLELQVPGIGETIAAAIEAFIGDVERFDNLKSFAAYFGVVPRSRRTGDKDKSRQRITKGGSSVLKQYIFLAAEVARRNDPELALTYEQASARGKHHFSAVIVVAHKLVRRIYALLKLRAQACRASTEGQTAQQPPAVAYRLTNPETGAPLSRSQARAYVDAHFPPKSAKAKKPSTAT